MMYNNFHLDTFGLCPLMLMYGFPNGNEVTIIYTQYFWSPYMNKKKKVCPTLLDGLATFK